ncbi:MAG TPA: hypothetical protein VEI29_01115 [Burkholderiaceae bacterium]|nr:hypothetical protein [Burkholderiaceae bacterium]
MTSKSPRPVAPAPTDANDAVNRERLRRQARRRRHWALWALLFPLLFTTVIALGLIAMFYKRMEFFRPSHAAARSCCVALIQSRAAAPEFAQT